MLHNARQHPYEMHRAAKRSVVSDERRVATQRFGQSIELLLASPPPPTTIEQLQHHHHHVSTTSSLVVYSIRRRLHLTALPLVLPSSPLVSPFPPSPTRALAFRRPTPPTLEMSGDSAQAASAQPQQRNLAEDIKVIVSYLKQPPFSRPFTLVTFSQLSPLQLLQLTNDLFATLDAKQAKDLRDEPSEQTTHRMIDFLITTLAYTPPSLASSPPPYSSSQLADFGSSFISASPPTVYPVLLHLLTHHASLRTRAYLAQYLSMPALPPDILSDPTVSSLLASLQARQEEFGQLHRGVEKEREGALHATGLKREVEQLESEREQLRTKMKRLQQKVDMDADDRKQGGGGGGGGPGSSSTPSSTFQAMLRLTNLLRLEQEEEQKLLHQREEQRTRLDDTRRELTHLRKAHDDQCKYHQVSKEGGGAGGGGEGGGGGVTVNPVQLLARMRAEVKDARDEVERVLEVELLDKEKALKQLQKATDALGADVVGEDELDELKTKVTEMERQLKRVEAEKEQLIGGSESQLGFLYDRLAAVQKKREKTAARLKEVEDEVDEARMEREKLEAEVDLLLRQRSDDERDGVPRGGKELKRYMEALAAKTARYKELKGVLDLGYAELALLQGTFNTLRARVVNQQELNGQLERLQGVEGWGAAESKLVDMTVQGRQLDDAKAETLEEISALVDRIDAEIKAKKNVLAPAIKELRGVRAAYEVVEVEWRGGKAAHEKIGLRYETERLKLEGEVKEKEEEKERVERVKWKARLEEAALRVKGDSLRDAAAARMYEEEVERQVKALERREKVLRKEKKAMNDNGNAHVNQRHMFKNVQLVLTTKLTHMEKAAAAQAGGREKNRMVF